MGVKLEIGLGLSDGIKQVSEAPVVHVGAREDGEGIALLTQIGRASCRERV